MFITLYTNNNRQLKTENRGTKYTEMMKLIWTGVMIMSLWDYGKCCVLRWLVWCLRNVVGWYMMPSGNTVVFTWYSI